MGDRYAIGIFCTIALLQYVIVVSCLIPYSYLNMYIISFKLCQYIPDDVLSILMYALSSIKLDLSILQIRVNTMSCVSHTYRIWRHDARSVLNLS